MINIHQSDKYQTFEELRCLPALQNGVIVISEKSPFMEKIPYSHMIVWCEYSEIMNKIKQTLNNYHSLHDSIFCKKNIQLLKRLDEDNKFNLERKINDILEAINQ